MSEIPRTKRLRLHLGETQDAFALRLGVSQGTIFRLEAGQKETGPQSLLLDAIEVAHPPPTGRATSHTQPELSAENPAPDSPPAEGGAA